jgi:HPt (histidine-containing phosphotransfer) domain-containing protein
MTAKISFTADVKESRFDFAFPTYSRDVPAAVLTSQNTASAKPAPIAPVAPVSLLSELKARSAEVESLLKSGTLGAIYVPALQAKDTALEIQASQPEAQRERLEPSVKQIVLAAYQLDSYGDVGDAEKAQEAFRGLSQAIAQLDSLVSERR